MAAEDEFEQTLLIVKTCCVYKLPPRTSTDGYRADEWDLANPIWMGRLKVCATSQKCRIILENQDDTVFAICPVVKGGPTAVEAVKDSSRYFTLRVEDGNGTHAFLGLGFKERTESFDFNVALQDFHKQLEREEEAAKGEQLPGLCKDYSLKEGQTIKVNIKRKANAPRKTVDLTAAPGASARPAPQPAAASGGWGQPAQATGAGGQQDPWGDFSDFQAAPNAASGNATAATGQSNWVTFE